MNNLAKCRVCDSREVQFEFEFKAMPIFLWPTPEQQEFFEQHHDLCLFICNSCRHVQVQNLSNKFLEQLYKHDYTNMESPQENQIRAKYLKELYQFSATNILDVGGGTNSTSESFPESFYTILDTQIPLSKKVIHLNGFISNITLKKQYYDFIFAFHILEHLENPRADLASLRNSLADHGKLIIEVPDTKYYSLKFPFYLYFHQHINLFNENSLHHLLSLAGFKRIECQTQEARILAIYEKNFDKVKKHNFEKIEPLHILNKNKIYFKALESFLLEIIDKNDDFHIDFLGAGGSATLFFYHCPLILSRVRNVYDSDPRKIGFNLPGTRKKIIKTPISFENETVYMGMGRSMTKNWINFDYNKFVDIFQAVEHLRIEND